MGGRLSGWWLPWISLQSFWHNGTPTSDVSAWWWWWGAELRETEGETREEEKAEGREGRQPVAHDHSTTSSNSTRLAPVHGCEVRKAAAGVERTVPARFPSCASLSAPREERAAAGELIEQHSEYFHFALNSSHKIQT